MKTNLSTLKTWLKASQVPQCGFSVEYAPEVLEEIRREAVEGFFALRGGMEIGGVLFGSSQPDGVRILAFRPLDCEHLHGPRFILSDKDRQGLATLLARSATDPGLRGMTPVGWFHTHTRSEILLCAKDIEIYNQFFPGERQLALVVRPAGFKPTRAGFFFRESNGEIRAESSYNEFVLGEYQQAPQAAECQPRPEVPRAPIAERTARPVPVPAIPAIPAIPPPMPMPAPPASRGNLVHRTGPALAAGVSAMLIWGGLTCAGSVLSARMAAQREAAPAIPAITRPAAVVPVHFRAEQILLHRESGEEQAPQPKVEPRKWACLRAEARTAPMELPALPQAPNPDLAIPQVGAGALPVAPPASAPRRVSFDGGALTFFKDAILVEDKKHPAGFSLPAGNVNYACESKSQTCTIAAAGTKVRVKHTTDYKKLVEYLNQVR